MLTLYIFIFVLLIVFSAFFSSAETSLLSLNKIKLNLKANKNEKKAVMLKKILSTPDEFFSTILIGNNFVNIAAASISTVLFTHLVTANEKLILLISTVATTIIVLIFAEIIPKSYAFRYSERLAYFYTLPIKFFNYLFHPFVKITSFLSTIVFKKVSSSYKKKELTIEEVKHFLSSEIQLFRYNPESLRMINEIIDIAEKDIKSIMTPRLNIIALEETADMDELMKIILDKKIAKIPLYTKNLDNITGIIKVENIVPELMRNKSRKIRLTDIAVKPIFISEYSSLLYVLKEFRRHQLNIAVILDEYSSAIGILTISDILREILGEIKISHKAIRKIGEGQFIIKGSQPVEEINLKLDIKLPEKKDYTTLSGMFIYYFGKFPREETKIKINGIRLMVTRMGRRKIEEILVEVPSVLVRQQNSVR